MNAGCGSKEDIRASARPNFCNRWKSATGFRVPQNCNIFCVTVGGVGEMSVQKRDDVNISKALLSALVCGLISSLGACATVTIGDVPSTATLNSTDESYYVLGLSPAQMRAMIVEGSVEIGQFEQQHVPLTPFVMNAPRDGFLVEHSGSGRMLELQQVFDESGAIPVAFAPCKTGAKALVFRAPPGTVVCIASLNFMRAGDVLAPDYSSDLEGARAFLGTHYPGLANKAEQGQYQLLTSDNTCGLTP